ncbi:MAG: toxin-antitoxin system TumE family protein [Nitrososphaerales archaeon]
MQKMKGSLKKISYSYQDAKNKIIFRYDNEVHYHTILIIFNREPPEASSDLIILKEITIKRSFHNHSIYYVV